MKIQVLGPGCKRCDQLYENAQQAAARVQGAGIEVEKVKELDELYKHGIFVTPGLVIDGQVISAGKLLTPDQIEEHIRKNQGV